MLEELQFTAKKINMIQTFCVQLREGSIKEKCYPIQQCDV